MPKNLVVALQTHSNNLVIEKSLGIGEKLYTKSSSVLAISQCMEIKKEMKELCISGPGYVFLQNEITQQPPNPHDAKSRLWVLLVFFIVFFLS